MIPAVTMPIAVVGLAASLLLGSMGVNNLLHIEKVQTEISLGDWVTESNAPELIEKFGDFPVVVKGGSGRGFFPISELNDDFEANHPDIGYIREVWIPSESNLEGIKEQIDRGTLNHGDYEYTVYEYYQTANWNGLVKGIFKDYKTAKNSKGKKNMWFNINEKQLEKAFGIKYDKKAK